MKPSSLWPLLPLVAVTAALELLTTTGAIPAYLMPAPHAVVAALGRGSADLWQAAGETSVAALIGFLASCVAGIAIGALLSTSRLIERIFYPYTVFFQTVPIIAIAPLLVVWVGYGMPTVIASAFIVSIFPMIANTLVGLRSTDPALLELFTLYRARPRDRLWKLRIPFSLPYLLTGARIASGLAVIGAIVGEFIGGGGLGGVVDEARTQQRLDRVFAAVLLASLLGLVFFAAIHLVTRFSLRRWHASEKF